MKYFLLLLSFVAYWSWGSQMSENKDNYIKPNGDIFYESWMRANAEDRGISLGSHVRCMKLGSNRGSSSIGHTAGRNIFAFTAKDLNLC